MHFLDSLGHRFKLQFCLVAQILQCILQTTKPTLNITGWVSIFKHKICLYANRADAYADTKKMLQQTLEAIAWSTGHESVTLPID